MGLLLGFAVGVILGFLSGAFLVASPLRFYGQQLITLERLLAGGPVTLMRSHTTGNILLVQGDGEGKVAQEHFVEPTLAAVIRQAAEATA